ncbi:YHS domain-containing protein [Candidatus Riflebacteria bacterium]
MKYFSVFLSFVLLFPISSMAMDMDEIIPDPRDKFNAVCPASGDQAEREHFVVLKDRKGKEHKVYLCCGMCKKWAKKNAIKAIYLAYPEIALKELGPNERCPVMGGEADPEAKASYKGATYYYCCPGCDKKFNKNPHAHAYRMAKKLFKKKFEVKKEDKKKKHKMKADHKNHGHHGMHH